MSSIFSNILYKNFIMKFNTDVIFDPKKEEPIQEPARKPVVVFCIPGKDFSQGFFNSWTKFLYFLNSNPVIDIHIVNYYLSNISQCRNAILGGKKSSGKYQLLFDGEWDYDFIFWLDTDVVFEPNDIARILMKLQQNSDVQVLSGIYAMGNGSPAVIVDDSPEVLHENDSYTTATIEDLLVDGTKHPHGLVKVKCPGMGFVAFKKNVFEKITYPWFENLKIDSPHFVDYDFEDVSLYKKLAKKDIFVYVDTETLIGHDKVSTVRL